MLVTVIKNCVKADIKVFYLFPILPYFFTWFHMFCQALWMLKIDTRKVFYHGKICAQFVHESLDSFTNNTSKIQK